jgi:prevent-host-death family protein
MVVSSVAPLQPAGEIHGSSAEQHGRGTLSRTSMNRAMTTVSATEARKRLYALIDEVGQSHEPVQITGKRSNAVLLSEDDWRAIQETLHLVSIPGMRESILEGMATEVSELSSEPLW